LHIARAARRPAALRRRGRHIIKGLSSFMFRVAAGRPFFGVASKRRAESAPTRIPDAMPDGMTGERTKRGPIDR
jgi:hypothetical protein